MNPNGQRVLYAVEAVEQAEKDLELVLLPIQYIFVVRNLLSLYEVYWVGGRKSGKTIALKVLDRALEIHGERARERERQEES